MKSNQLVAANELSHEDNTTTSQSMSKKTTQFKLGKTNYVPGRGRNTAENRHLSKCASLLAFVRPAALSAQEACKNALTYLLDKVEESKNDQFAEYPFDDGWKCAI